MSYGFPRKLQRALADSAPDPVTILAATVDVLAGEYPSCAFFSYLRNGEEFRLGPTACRDASTEKSLPFALSQDFADNLPLNGAVSDALTAGPGAEPLARAIHEQDFASIVVVPIESHGITDGLLGAASRDVPDRVSRTIDMHVECAAALAAVTWTAVAMRREPEHAPECTGTARAAAREQSDREYRTLVETMPYGILVLDGSGSVTFSNSTARSMLAPDGIEIAGRFIDELIAFARHESFLAGITSPDDTESGAGPLPGRSRLKPEAAVDVQIDWNYRSDPHGNQCGYVLVVTDITERKRFEEALRRSERKYRQVVEHAGDVVFLTDSDGIVTYVNQTCLNVAGYEQDEIVGKPYADFIPEYAREEVVRFYGIQFVKGIDNTYYEFPLTSKSGDVLYFGQNVQLIRHGEEIVGFQAIARDITERYRMEESLRQSEEKYRTIIENIEEGYYEVDLNGDMMFCNEALCRILGYERDELQGVNNRVYMEESTAKAAAALFREVHETGLPTQMTEWTLIHKDGAKLIVEGSVSLVADTSGKPTGFRGICRDVTERKQQEEIIRQSERFRAVADLASGVAHNFNNLLQIAGGGTQLALMELEKGNLAAVKRSLDQIAEVSDLGTETVRRLQSFARIRTDDAGGHDSVFDLSDIVRQSVQLTKTWWQGKPQKKGVHVDLNLELEDGCMVEGKKNELFEVAVNLMKNAAEAVLTRGGEILLQTRVLDQEVIFKVRDTGIGIPRENLGRLFTPFFTTKFGTGTGLGLASCRAVINRHGGNIFVDSMVDRGTTFTIHLPFAAQGRLADLEKDTASETIDFHLRILIIDDMQPMVDTLAHGLAKHDQTVLKALSGSEGLRLFQQNPVDLIICDLAMPGMNGWDLGRAVRAVCESRGIEKPPFILLTGWADQTAEHSRMSEAGVDLILEKPVEFRMLLRRIRELMKNRKDGDQQRLERSPEVVPGVADVKLEPMDRTSIVEMLRKELVRSSREGSPVGVMLGEVDGLDDLTIERGPDVVEAVISEVYRRISRAVRPYDSLGGYGRSTFLLMSPGCGPDNVHGVAERLRRLVDGEPVTGISGSFSVSLSIGAVSIQGIPGIDAEAVIASCFTSLGKARAAGGNQVCVQPDMKTARRRA